MLTFNVIIVFGVFNGIFISLGNFSPRNKHYHNFPTTKKCLPITGYKLGVFTQSANINHRMYNFGKNYILF